MFFFGEAQGMQGERLQTGRTFLLGFGFFGVSVIWALYNAYVPIFLKESFHLRSHRLLRHELCSARGGGGAQDRLRPGARKRRSAGPARRPGTALHFPLAPVGVQDIEDSLIGLQ
jgi:hypothetical protein